MGTELLGRRLGDPSRSFVPFFLSAEGRCMARGGRRFVGCEVNQPILNKIDELRRLTGGKSTSAILRALVLGAKPENLPRGWIVPENERALVALVEGRE
jgi:hypothetical protein